MRRKSVLLGIAAGDVGSLALWRRPAWHVLPIALPPDAKLFTGLKP